MSQKSLSISLLICAVSALLFSFMISSTALAGKDIDTCKKDTQDAEKACQHPEKPEGMQSGDNSSNGQASQCDSQKQMSDANAAAVKEAAGKCEAAMGKCKDSCSDGGEKAQQEPQKSQEKGQKKQQLSKCTANQSFLDQMNGQSGNYGSNSGTNSQCQKGSGTMPQFPQMSPSPGQSPSPPPTPKPPPTCENDPNFAATSVTCAKYGDHGQGALSLSGGGLSPTAPKGLISIPGAAPAVPPESSSAKAAGGGSNSAGGGSSGLGGSGSGAVKVNGKEQKTAKKEDPQAGAVGGGGGGGGGGGRSGYDADLDSFKNNQDKKGATGMSIKPVDGITGPLGATLFEKVTKQYQIQKTNLIP